jgi:glucokinase
MAAANFVSLFNPQMLIFGGGVFGPATKYIDKIYQEASKWAQPIAIKECRFAATALPDTAGLYGAGAIAAIGYANSLKQN